MCATTWASRRSSRTASSRPGSNSIGLQSAGGIGKVVAEWIRDGHPPIDLWEVDVRRNMPFQINRKYLQARVSESLGLAVRDALAVPPIRDRARAFANPAVHDRLAAGRRLLRRGLRLGARQLVRARGRRTPAYDYSYGRQNWFEHSAREHRAVRSAVGLFDQSSFAKFRLEGADAARVLNRVCANDVDVRPGQDGLHAMAERARRHRGGSDRDAARRRPRILIVTGAETESKDFNWLKRHIDPQAHCVLTNVTSGMGVLSLMGPRARELLQSLTPDDLSDAAFPFATSRVIELGYALVRASRITYVGELGWELYVPTEFMQGVYDELAAAGVRHGLVHAGYHALNSLRIEKAYRHWGHDITDEDTPWEARSRVSR